MSASKCYKSGIKMFTFLFFSARQYIFLLAMDLFFFRLLHQPEACRLQIRGSSRQYYIPGFLRCLNDHLRQAVEEFSLPGSGRCNK